MRALILFGLFWCIAFSDAMALQPPPQDYVLRFGGLQYALAPDAPGLIPGENFTMAGWFFWESAAEPEIVLLGQLANPFDQIPYTARLLRTRFDGKLEFLVNTSTGGASVEGPEPPVGQWVHIAGTLSGQIIRLFVNGVEIGSADLGGAPHTQVTRFSVGAAATEQPAPFNGFSGFARQISVWAWALDQSQIQTLATTHLSGNEPTLVAYWKLDESPESLVAEDSGPNNLDLRFDQRFYSPHWAEHRPTPFPSEAVDQPYFEVTEQTLFDFSYIRNAVVSDIYVLDLDGDGLDDFITTDVAFDDFREIPLRAFRNNGDLSFTEITDTKLGEVNVVLGRFGSVADFNADGVDDLLIVDTGPDTDPFPGRQNTLLLGDADGKMFDGSTTNLPLINNLNHALDVADIDGDGDIDAFAGQQGRPGGEPFEEKIPEVFVNDGTGVFSLENSRLPESQLLVAALSIEFLDLEKDGDADAILNAAYDGGSDYFGRDALVVLYNDGDGNFSFAGPGDMIDNELYHEDGKLVVEFVDADVDNDGLLDLIASWTFHYNGMGIWLFRNNGDGTMTKINGAFNSQFFDSPIQDYWLAYLRAGDFNNDGWIDLFAEGGPSGDFLFINNGDLTFTNESRVLTPGLNLFDSGSNLMDIDNDGRLDIIAVNDGKLQMLRNVRDLPSPATTNPPPVSPVPLDANEIAEYEPITWSDPGNSYEYEIQIATDRNFTNLVFGRVGLTGISIVPTGLTSGENYYWRVRGKNTAGLGAYSLPSLFCFGGNCPEIVEDEPKASNLILMLVAYCKKFPDRCSS